MAHLCGGTVSRVESGSLADILGICPGDKIISVNGHVLRDELDFRFYVSEELVTLKIQTVDGHTYVIDVEKEASDSLGVEFEEPIFDRIKTCVNNCCFCFLRQLPPNMRSELYLHDDDYRMSFLYGNFISLTNLTQEDWERLKEQRLSPLRVSVHATDGQIRSRIMGNQRAAGILDDLDALISMGIGIHVQIVLLRGINDGCVLLDTLDDLKGLGGKILSVGVVPAVYTKYREFVPSSPPTPEWSAGIIDMIQEISQEMLRFCGTNWVWAADELYVLAGRPVPPYEYYEDFPQYENGIGLISDFDKSLSDFKTKYGKPGEKSRFGAEILVVTGKMFEGYLRQAVKSLGMDGFVQVLPVENRFFGPAVTCAGLLTGRDIICALAYANQENTGPKFAKVFIPSVCVKAGRFLDDLTLKDVSNALGLQVKCAGDFESFLSRLKEG